MLFFLRKSYISFIEFRDFSYICFKYASRLSSDCPSFHTSVHLSSNWPVTHYLTNWWKDSIKSGRCLTSLIKSINLHVGVVCRVMHVYLEYIVNTVKEDEWIIVNPDLRSDLYGMLWDYKSYGINVSYFLVVCCFAFEFLTWDCIKCLWKKQYK